MQARLPEIDALQSTVQQCQQEISNLESQAQKDSQAALERQKDLEGQLAEVEAQVTSKIGSLAARFLTFTIVHA